MPTDKNELPLDPSLLPELEEPEWDEALEQADEISEDDLEIMEDLAGTEENGEESLEEDDDNPYQDSDQALPDDEEEAAIAKKLRREGSGSFEIG